MAIQMRRGAYSDLDPSKLVPGEVVIVLSGDPGLYIPVVEEGYIEGDGTGVYVCTETGTVKRLVSQDELNAVLGLLMPDQEEPEPTSDK